MRQKDAYIWTFRSAILKCTNVHVDYSPIPMNCSSPLKSVDRLGSNGWNLD